MPFFRHVVVIDAILSTLLFFMALKNRISLNCKHEIVFYVFTKNSKLLLLLLLWRIYTDVMKTFEITPRSKSKAMECLRSDVANT